MSRRLIFCGVYATLTSCLADNPDYSSKDHSFDFSSSTDMHISTDSVTVPEKRLFITSVAYHGNFLSDTLCKDLAQSANLGSSSWIAWFSSAPQYDPSDAINRIYYAKTAVGPWYRLDGVKVFENVYGLTSLPLAPIDVDEKYKPVSHSEFVWTGTRIGGKRNENYCYDEKVQRAWSTSDKEIRGDVGKIGQIDETWTNNGTQPCSSVAHIICLEL